MKLSQVLATLAVSALVVPGAMAKGITGANRVRPVQVKAKHATKRVAHAHKAARAKVKRTVGAKIQPQPNKPI